MKLNEILNQKKLTYMILGIIIILASVLTINALISGTKHSQSNILITKNNYTMTLQEAIAGNYLNVGAASPSSSGTTSVIFGHSPSEIWVSVDGVESTLAAAIAADNLCGSTSVPYTGSINPGHLASEIEVVVGGSTKTLQQAIDDGDFCGTCYDVLTSNWPPCQYLEGTYTGQINYYDWQDWGICSWPYNEGVFCECGWSLDLGIHWVCV